VRSAPERRPPETGILLKLARKTLRQLDSMWDAIPQEIYRPRNPQATDLHRLVEDNFNQLERVWYERQFRD
jgi:RNAse (barnase) inhibitor barstar